MKIIGRLEEATLNNNSVVEVHRIKNKIFYTSKANHFAILLINITFIIAPFYLLYAQKEQLNMFVIIILVACSAINFISYYKGPLKTNNNIVVDIEKREISLIRKGIIGKLLLNDKIITIQTDLKLVEENIPLSILHQTRITLKIDGERIPLLDIYKSDSNYDDIFLSLKLIASNA